MKKTYILIIIFLVIGSYIIISSYNLSLQEKQDRKTFLAEAFKWIFNVGKSTKNTVTYAVKQDWLPEVDKTETNKTNETETTYVLYEIDE